MWAPWSRDYQESYGKILSCYLNLWSARNFRSVTSIEVACLGRSGPGFSLYCPAGNHLRSGNDQIFILLDKENWSRKRLAEGSFEAVGNMEMGEGCGDLLKEHGMYTFTVNRSKTLKAPQLLDSNKMTDLPFFWTRYWIIYWKTFTCSMWPHSEKG